LQSCQLILPTFPQEAAAQTNFDFTATTTDGVFSLTGHYTNEPTTLTNPDGTESVLHPSGIKFDVRVDDYPCMHASFCDPSPPTQMLPTAPSSRSKLACAPNPRFSCQPVAEALFLSAVQGGQVWHQG
jgi:hypothetical protein